MGLGLALGAAALSGGMGILGASQQKKAAKQQADVYRKQAAHTRERAAQAFEAGEHKAVKRSKQLAQRQGSNRAAFAGKGLLVDGGATADDIYDTNAAEAAQDISIINENTKNTVDSMAWDAANLDAKASATEAAGKQAFNKSLFDAGLGLATAVGSWGLGTLATGGLLGAKEAATAAFKAGDMEGYASALDSMENYSLLQGAGSLLAGMGGGSKGQSIYDSWSRVDLTKKSLQKSFSLPKSGLMSAFGF